MINDYNKMIMTKRRALVNMLNELGECRHCVGCFQQGILGEIKN